MTDESQPDGLAALPRFSRQLWRAWATVDCNGRVIDPRYRVQLEFTGDPKQWWSGRNRRDGTDRRSVVRESYLTTAQIADAINMTATSVSNLFRGKIMKPTYDVIDKLATLLCVTPGYFFSDDDPDVVRVNVERGLTDTVPVTTGEDPAMLGDLLRRLGHSEITIAVMMKVAQIRSPQALEAIDSVAAVLISTQSDGTPA